MGMLYYIILWYIIVSYSRLWAWWGGGSRVPEGCEVQGIWYRDLGFRPLGLGERPFVVPFWVSYLLW